MIEEARLEELSTAVRFGPSSFLGWLAGRRYRARTCPPTR